MEPHDQSPLELGIMSFGDHLQELRARLFKALLVPLPLAIALFFFAPDLRELLVRPLFAALRANGQTVQIQALSPAETIATDMKLAIIAAIAFSAPWVLFQLWKFIEPGLYRHERRYVYFLTPLSTALTLCGIALFYWVLLPFTLIFLVNFGAPQARKVDLPPAAAEGAGATASAPPAFAFAIVEEDPETPAPGEAWISARDQVLRIAVPLHPEAPNAVVELASEASAAIVGAEGDGKPKLSILEVPLTVLGGISQIYRLSEYVSFTLMLMLGAVVAFQMPVVILLLGWVGFISPRFLREKRRWAILIMSIVAAVVTPPDVMSMLLLLGPLWLLYEFGIVLLVLVPAHKVSQGRVFSVGWTSRRASRAAQSEPSRRGTRGDGDRDGGRGGRGDDDAGAEGGST